MKDKIQFTQLGNFGRFGNQLFQYVFAKSLAEKYNSVLEIPEDWVGRKIFKNIDCPSISSNLPKTSLDQIPDHPNIDLYGYYQSMKSLKYLKISKIKQWLQIEDKWLRLFKKKRTLCCLPFKKGRFYYLF